MRALVLALIFVTACGAAVGQGSPPLPPPSPPTTALAAWKDFPANANPRPIITFGVTTEHIQPSGFPTSDRKIAWLCNKFVLASDVQLSTVVPGTPSGAGNRSRSIGPAPASAERM